MLDIGTNTGVNLYPGHTMHPQRAPYEPERRVRGPRASDQLRRHGDHEAYFFDWSNLRYTFFEGRASSLWWKSLYL